MATVANTPSGPIILHGIGAPETQDHRKRHAARWVNRDGQPPMLSFGGIGLAAMAEPAARIAECLIAGDVTSAQSIAGDLARKDIPRTGVATLVCWVAGLALEAGMSPDELVSRLT